MSQLTLSDQDRFFMILQNAFEKGEREEATINELMDEIKEGLELLTINHHK